MKISLENIFHPVQHYKVTSHFSGYDQDKILVLYLAKYGNWLTDAMTQNSN